MSKITEKFNADEIAKFKKSVDDLIDVVIERANRLNAHGYEYSRANNAPYVKRYTEPRKNCMTCKLYGIRPSVMEMFVDAANKMQLNFKVVRPFNIRIYSK